jgi:3-mercaptopyruvate sulfurtransferase SseA
VALQMKKLGFVRVHPLLGGLQGWLALDLPVESREVVDA